MSEEPEFVNATPVPPEPADRDPMGLAIASLVLGICALLFSVLGLGALLALIGLVLGGIHLAKGRRPRSMAVTGILLSVVGLVLSGALVAGLVNFAQRMFDATELQAEPYAEWLGQEVPDLEVTTLSGETLQLSALRGRHVVLNFWATWCPPCVREIPHLVQLAGEYPAEELLIVGVSNEEAATLASFVQDKGVNYPIASATGRLPDPYGRVRSIPTTFFIDAEGRLIHVGLGYHSYKRIKKHTFEDAPDAPSTTEISQQ